MKVRSLHEPVSQTSLAEVFTVVNTTVWARLPVAVFLLACRKSSRTPQSSYALPVVPW